MKLNRSRSDGSGIVPSRKRNILICAAVFYWNKELDRWWPKTESDGQTFLEKTTGSKHAKFSGFCTLTVPLTTGSNTPNFASVSGFLWWQDTISAAVKWWPARSQRRTDVLDNIEKRRLGPKTPNFASVSGFLYGDDFPVQLPNCL